MQCPYCSEEMKPGYIQCKDEIWWSEKKRLFAASSFTSGEIISLATKYHPLSGALVIAHCCKRCKKIVIDFIDESCRTHS